MTAPQGPTDLTLGAIVDGQNIDSMDVLLPFSEAETAIDEARTTALCKEGDTVHQYVQDMLVAGSGITLTPATVAGATTITIANALTVGKRATLWADEVTSTSGAAISPSVRNAQRYNTTVGRGAAANGDKFTTSCMLAAGTYTFYVLGRISDNFGIAKWTVNGTVITSTQDWYSAEPADNAIKSVASVVIAADGLVTIECEVNGKNASSSDYFLSFVKFWFKQASD